MTIFEQKTNVLHVMICASNVINLKTIVNKILTMVKAPVPLYRAVTGTNHTIEQVIYMAQ